MTLQVFVIFHDSREATKMLEELQTGPLILGASGLPIELQCLVVQRSMVESVSDSAHCHQSLNLIQEIDDRNLLMGSVFPEAVILLEVVDQETNEENVAVSLTEMLQS